MIYGWIRTRDGARNDPRNWSNIHDQVEWPQPGQSLDFDQFGARAHGKRVEFADLADPASMEQTLKMVADEMQRELDPTLMGRNA